MHQRADELRIRKCGSLHFSQFIFSSQDPPPPHLTTPNMTNLARDLFLGKEHLSAHATNFIVGKRVVTAAIQASEIPDKDTREMFIESVVAPGLVTACSTLFAACKDAKGTKVTDRQCAVLNGVLYMLLGRQEDTDVKVKGSQKTLRAMCEYIQINWAVACALRAVPSSYKSPEAKRDTVLAVLSNPVCFKAKPKSDPHSTCVIPGLVEAIRLSLDGEHATVEQIKTFWSQLMALAVPPGSPAKQPAPGSQRKIAKELQAARIELKETTNKLEDTKARLEAAIEELAESRDTVETLRARLSQSESQSEAAMSKMADVATRIRDICVTTLGEEPVVAAKKRKAAEGGSKPTLKRKKVSTHEPCPSPIEQPCPSPIEQPGTCGIEISDTDDETDDETDEETDDDMGSEIECESSSDIEPATPGHAFRLRVDDGTQ